MSDTPTVFHKFHFHMTLERKEKKKPLLRLSAGPSVVNSARVHIFHVAKTDDVERVSKMASPISKRVITHIYLSLPLGFDQKSDTFILENVP